MQPFPCLRWLVSFLLILGSLSGAHATHVIGGDIAYASIPATTAGVPRYHVTVRLFLTDTPGAAQQPQVVVNFSRNGCSSTDPNNFQATILASPLSSPAPPYPLGCAGANLYPSYRIRLYETDVNLPSGQWTISLVLGNRAIVYNIDDPLTQYYLSSFLDNTLVSADSSPRFLSTLLPVLNGNLAQRNSFSTFDSEGDSLAYSFVRSQQVVAPLNQCGADAPGSLSPHFQLNSATGALTAAAGPVQQGFYVMAVRVTEYRKLAGSWRQLGWVTRDIVYTAENIANQPPHFTSLAVGAGAAQQFATPLAVRPGQTISLTLTATDPDAGQNLRFTSESPSIIPGLSFQTLSATQARLTWQVPATLPLGRYTAVVAVIDDGCPINSVEEQTISFVVTNQTLATAAASTNEAGAFPIPFRDQVQFRVANAGQAVVIVDALGRVVARLSSQADGRVVWQPASTLPAGVYVARSADGKLLARLLHSE